MSHKWRNHLFFLKKVEKVLKSGGSDDSMDEGDRRGSSRPRIVDGRKKSPSRSSKPRDSRGSQKSDRNKQKDRRNELFTLLV